MNNYKETLKSLGLGTQIFEYAKLVKTEVIEIGDNCKIDDFTFIYGGEGIKIGNNTHIASFVSIIGGGKLTIGNDVGLSQGVRVITGTNDYRTGKCSAASKKEEQGFYLGHVQIEDDVIVFSNAVITPNVKIGEGAVIGALSLVNRDVEPWSVNVGTPIKKIGMRPRL